MAITRQTMTDEQRKSVALEYLKAFDNKGVTSSGGSILDLFADDAQVFFPKWGLATGKKQIRQLFTDFGGGIKHILHDYATFNWIMTGTDVFAVEGTSAGEHKDGPWRAGVVARRPVVRRVRGARLPDSALLHLSRSRLRRARHRALSLAVGGRPRPVEADGVIFGSGLWTIVFKILCSSPRHADGGRCDGDGLGVRSDSTPRQNGASARVQRCRRRRR